MQVCGVLITILLEITSSDNDSVISFGVDNSSSSHADNCNNNFLVLSEGPTLGIEGSFGSAEKKFSINFSKTNTKSGLSLHYNADNVICLLMEKKSLRLKPTIKMLTFQLNFFLETYLMDLVLLSLEKYLLN